MLFNYCLFNLISSDLGNMIMGNRTFTIRDTKLSLTYQMAQIIKVKLTRDNINISEM